MITSSTTTLGDAIRSLREGLLDKKEGKGVICHAQKPNEHRETGHQRLRYARQIVITFGQHGSSEAAEGSKASRCG